MAPFAQTTAARALLGARASVVAEICKVLRHVLRRTTPQVAIDQVLVPVRAFALAAGASLQRVRLSPPTAVRLLIGIPTCTTH